MNVTEQLEILTNISMVGNLNLTIGDAALLAEIIDEVINSTEIDNAVSVHVLGGCTSVDICFTGWQCCMCVVCYVLCVFCVLLYVLCCVVCVVLYALCVVFVCVVFCVVRIVLHLLCV